MTAEMLWKPLRAAQELGISVITLMQHVNAGEIVYVPIGRGTIRRRIAFTPADIQSFIDHRRSRVSYPSAITKAVPTINVTSKSGSIDFMAMRAEKEKRDVQLTEEKPRARQTNSDMRIRR